MSRFLTPPEVAELLRVNQSKILAWIHSGELRAADVSSVRSGRPRWRIAEDDLQSFLSRRAATPAPKTQRRRRKQDAAVIEFY